MEVKRSCESAQALRINEMIAGAKIPFKNGVIKWFIGNFTNDLEKHEQILIFKDVFRHYERENFPLVYDSTSKKDEAYIKIYFVAPDGYVYCDGEEKFKSPHEFDENTLAVAYAPYNGKWKGYVFINDSLFWVLRKTEDGKHTLYDTLLHELGHTHNMDHSTIKSEIMYFQEGENQTWGKDSQGLLFDIYKDDRLNAAKKSESAKLLIGYSNQYASGRRETTTVAVPIWLTIVYVIFMIIFVVFAYMITR